MAVWLCAVHGVLCVWLSEALLRVLESKSSEAAHAGSMLCSMPATLSVSGS
eukprot:COSAG01_NODE_10449_length_2163_cov_1.530039_1_plen_50_part_10